MPRLRETHDVSVTYSLQDHGSFKASNYTLASTTDTLRGEITNAGIHLSPTEDDGVLRFSEGRMIGDSSIVGFTKLIRPVTVTQGMTAVHYIALKHPPTADVTITLKMDPPSFFEKAYHVQRSAHFSASSYQPGAVGESVGICRDSRCHRHLHHYVRGSQRRPALQRRPGHDYGSGDPRQNRASVARSPLRPYPLTNAVRFGPLPGRALVPGASWMAIRLRSARTTARGNSWTITLRRVRPDTRESRLRSHSGRPLRSLMQQSTAPSTGSGVEATPRRNTRVLSSTQPTG